MHIGGALQLLLVLKVGDGIENFHPFIMMHGSDLKKMKNLEMPIVWRGDVIGKKRFILEHIYENNYYNCLL